MTPSTGTVPTEGQALRRVRSSEINSVGKIRKSAFMPRAEGQDRAGLSVSIETAHLRAQHKAKFESRGHRACCVAFSGVRGLGLDVTADPRPDDEAHALITG